MSIRTKDAWRPRPLAKLAIGVTLAVSSACGGDAPPPAVTPAAKIQAPVKEAALTTVTLTAEAEARLGIKTAAVEQKAVARTRTAGGEIIAPPGAEIAVTAPSAGTLEAADAAPAPGTMVRRGHAMFRLLPIGPSERNALVDAERSAGEAAARQDLATKRLQRAKQLVQDGAGSRRAVDEAQADLAVADADLKAARDRVMLAARGTLPGGGITINAPAAGLLRSVHAHPGQTVAAGSALFDLVQLDTVWVRVPLYVGESAGIDPRAPARIVGLGDPPTSDGVLARPVTAPPSADSATAGIDLFFSLANAGHAWRPGQRVAARLAQRGEAPRLVLPRSAILHDASGGTWVYEAREPHVFVRRRTVVVDLVGSLAVLDVGPPVGTKVVTEGAAELFGTEFGVGK